MSLASQSQAWVRTQTINFTAYEYLVMSDLPHDLGPTHFAGSGHNKLALI